MKETLTYLSFYCVIAIALTLLSLALGSDFILLFMEDKLVEILITLLAINTATSSFIIAKIGDIYVENIAFTKTINEIKKSLYEQIVIICVAFLICLIHDSNFVPSTSFKNFQQLTTAQIWLTSIFTFAYVFLFIYALDILRDTGKAVFEFYKYQKKSG